MCREVCFFSAVFAHQLDKLRVMPEEKKVEKKVKPSKTAKVIALKKECKAYGNRKVKDVVKLGNANGYVKEDVEATIAQFHKYVETQVIEGSAEDSRGTRERNFGELFDEIGKVKSEARAVALVRHNVKEKEALVKYSDGYGYMKGGDHMMVLTTEQVAGGTDYVPYFKLNKCGGVSTTAQVDVKMDATMFGNAVERTKGRDRALWFAEARVAKRSGGSQRQSMKKVMKKGMKKGMKKVIKIKKVMKKK